MRYSLFLTLLGVLTVANAGGYIEDKEPATTDSFQEANKTVGNKDRSAYMPRLITPDNLKSGLYGGLGIAFSSLAANTSPSIISKKAGNNRMMDLSVVAGYNFNKYLSAESRAMISNNYDNGVDFKSWGIFLKPKYEIYKDVEMYSLLGVGKIKANNTNDSRLKVSKANMQLGVGANYKLKNNFKIFADYMYLGKDASGRYNNKPAVMKSSAITTGVTYDF